MRFLRLPEVCRRVGYSPMHIWRLEKAGRFPQRVKLGPNSVAWVEQEIDAWCQARVAERDARKGDELAVNEEISKSLPDNSTVGSSLSAVGQ